MCRRHEDFKLDIIERKLDLQESFNLLNDFFVIFSTKIEDAIQNQGNMDHKSINLSQDFENLVIPACIYRIETLENLVEVLVPLLNNSEEEALRYLNSKSRDPINIYKIERISHFSVININNVYETFSSCISDFCMLAYKLCKQTLELDVRNIEISRSS
jgi:hypothetical protein